MRGIVMECCGEPFGSSHHKLCKENQQLHIDLHKSKELLNTWNYIAAKGFLSCSKDMERETRKFLEGNYIPNQDLRDAVEILNNLSKKYFNPGNHRSVYGDIIKDFLDRPSIKTLMEEKG